MKCPCCGKELVQMETKAFCPDIECGFNHGQYDYRQGRQVSSSEAEHWEDVKRGYEYSRAERVPSDSLSSKPTNPKDAIGANKLPLHLWPTTATALGSIAMLNGMLKYGRSNFRAVGVRASIYYDAAMRHLNAWFEGEELDPDDGVPHLGAALACIAIIVDAGAAGKLTDDRAIAGGYHKFKEELTNHVQRLKDLHAERTPKHYSIEDSKGPQVVMGPACTPREFGELINAALGGQETGEDSWLKREQ
jgi:hypothetical protein